MQNYHLQTLSVSESLKFVVWERVKLNPSPHMPILGSSYLVANKDTMSKIWTNGDTII